MPQYTRAVCVSFDFKSPVRIFTIVNHIFRIVCVCVYKCITHIEQFSTRPIFVHDSRSVQPSNASSCLHAFPLFIPLASCIPRGKFRDRGRRTQGAVGHIKYQKFNFALQLRIKTKSAARRTLRVSRIKDIDSYLLNVLLNFWENITNVCGIK